jgi:hypothetical protein
MESRLASPLLAAAFVCSLSGAGLCAQRPDAPPICDNGGPYSAECLGLTTSVQLDGTGSSSQNGQPLTFFWLEECPYGFIPDPTSPTPILEMDMNQTCQRTCVVELKVTAGNQFKKCQTTISVQDTTAPLIACPPDVTDIWGAPTAPGATGNATASDNCDPNPSLGYLDSTIPQLQIGDPEQVIKRTWTALDACNHSASCVQTITLLSPSTGQGGGANLDLDISSCPNLFDTSSNNLVQALVLGQPDFRAQNVVKSSLKLSRANDLANFVKPAQFKVKDLGSQTATQYGECNSSVLDGRSDLQLSFNRNQMVNHLGLGSLPSGTVVDVVLTGKMTSGKVFAIRDSLTIQ